MHNIQQRSATETPGQPGKLLSPAPRGHVSQHADDPCNTCRSGTAHTFTNRRLKAEGTNFRDLLNEARFSVSRQLLAGTKMDVIGISLALGYSEPSSFTHAFQRWSGMTPSEWRKQ
ncbi:AraC family transcriptional regulator [Bradyrhizobium sp. LA6.12]|uniref:helix-turn-helix domain-containing protein n=1 Tax=unclassified Bradyrhizobium TaxID=2631580 RepID=UPI0033982A6B